MTDFARATLITILCIAGFYASSVLGQAAIRFPPRGISYEDSVRIVILWNDPLLLYSKCEAMDSVGVSTKNFVVKALSGGRIGNPYNNPHIKILKTIETWYDTVGTKRTRRQSSPGWGDIKKLWGGDTLPHVIVHINAGYGDRNGDSLKGIFDSAVSRYIGIAEIGDDASWLASTTFGLTVKYNEPWPIYDGTQFSGPRDSLLIGLHPKKDRLLDSTKYPYLNGVVRNTTKLANNDSTLYFKPYISYPSGTILDSTGRDTIRCQADADQYTILPGQESKLTMLGFQNACWNAGKRLVGSTPAEELDVIVAFQDTIRPSLTEKYIRRAIALSYQPQFLKNSAASFQLTYDAIMYASLAWQLRPVSIQLFSPSDTTNPIGNGYPVPVGTPFIFTTRVYDTNGDVWRQYNDSLSWTVKNSAGTIIAQGKGDSISFPATSRAYDTLTITVSMPNPLDPAKLVIRETTVVTSPGKAHHLTIQNTPVVTSLRSDQKIRTITMDEVTEAADLYAVFRDSYGNYVDSAKSALWISSAPSIATVAPAGNGWQGVVTKVDAGSALIIASSPGLIPDTVAVTLKRCLFSIRLHHVTPPDYSDTSHPIDLRDTAVAGVPFSIIAHAFDNFGTLHSELDTFFSWTMTDSLETVLTRVSGDSTTLIPHYAHGTVALTATVSNPGNPAFKPVTKTIHVYIKPGKPHHITIQGSPVVTSLRQDQSMGTLTIDEKSATASLYAVIRDSFGNYIDSGNSAAWSSTDTSIATVAAGNKNWEGIITKRFLGIDSIIAASMGLIPDTVAVNCKMRIKNVVTATPANNPAGPRNPITDPRLISFYRQVIGNEASGALTGALIGIQSTKPLIPRSEGFFGAASVYDATGNLVADNIPVKSTGSVTKDHASYGVYWNLRNRNGRHVGSGTYLMVISTTDLNNQLSVASRKIGVSR